MNQSDRTIIQHYCPPVEADNISNELLSDIVHRVGHEIGNPLTSIISLASIIERFQPSDSDEKSSGQFASSILKEAWKVGNIVEKLVLLLSQRETTSEEFSPIELVQKACTRLRNRSSFSLDEVIIRLEEDDQSTCSGDPELLLVAISELLANALSEFEKSNQEMIAPIVTIKNKSGILGIEVTNEIETDCAPFQTLFQHLQRGEQYKPGVGVGLPTVAKIAHRLGANFTMSEWINPAQQRFFSTLIEIGENISSEFDQETEASSSSEGLPTIKILIVEDQAPVASAIEKILTLSFKDRATLDCVCTNGRGALEFLKGNSPIDVILCDLQLSSMQGSAIYKWINDNRPKLSSRFAFMTGGNLPPMFSSIPCLQKPFEPDELMAITEKLLPKKL